MAAVLENQHLAAEGEAREGAKRIAFLTVTLSGHRRLAVSLAAEMAARGFPVDLLVGVAGVNDELRELERDHPNFTLYPMKGTDLISDIDWPKVASSSGRLGGSKYALFQSFNEIVRYLPDAIVQWKEMIEVLSASRPDVILLDHAHKVLQQWAEERGIPTVILHTPYFQTGDPTGCACMSPEDSQKLDDYLEESNPFEKFEEAKGELGVKGARVTLGEGSDGAREGRGLTPHTFVFCEPELLHVAHLPPRVHAVGPCLSDRDPLDADAHLRPWLDAAAVAKEKVLYVAFGTLANGFLTMAAVETLLDTFEHLGESWRVLWSLPRAQQALLAQSGRSFDTARIRIEPYVRQRAVLIHPAVQVFLTHAGQTSANEGIAAGCPLVCLPLFCDQYEMAESVARHCLGLVFHKDELLEGQSLYLRSLITRVDAEPLFRRTARRHAQLMRIRGGCRRAAELIESIALVGTDFGELWEGPGEEGSEGTPAVPLPRAVHEAAAPATAPARTLLQQPVAPVKSACAVGGDEPACAESAFRVAGPRCTAMHH